MASPATSLFYSCIAHNSTILTECTTSASSQTSSLASLILPKIQHRAPEKLTYTHGAHFIHYIAEAASQHTQDGPGGHPSSAGGLTFLVISDANIGRRIPFNFLVGLRDRFLADFAPDTTDYGDLPNYGCAAFNATLRQMMHAEESGAEGGGGGGDALSNVRRDIDDVRGIMGRNIESLLQRGERIDLLVDQTDRLGGSAHDFRVRSRGLKRQMWWKNIKLMALIGVVVLVLILLIVVSVKT